MSLNSSRKKLIAVLVLGALLLSAPFLWNAWTAARELNGKVAAFDAPTTRPVKDVLGCLVQRPEGGLKLQIMAMNHFADTDRGITVRIEPQAGGARLKAWIDQGKTLTQGETAQLSSCAG